MENSRPSQVRGGANDSFSSCNASASGPQHPSADPPQLAAMPVVTAVA